MSWNMLTINPQIHRQLDRAYFGLKLITTLPNQHEGGNPEMEVIRVEWRWLPRKLSEALNSCQGEHDDVFIKRDSGKFMFSWKVNVDCLDLVN